MKPWQFAANVVVALIAFAVLSPLIIYWKLTRR